MVEGDELLNMFLNFPEEKGWREMNCDEYISRFLRRKGGGRRRIVMNIFLDLLEEEGVEGDELMNIFLDFLEEEGVEGGEEREYLESPISDGTIEEDFEEALARYFFYINKPFIIQLVHNN